MPIRLTHDSTNFLLTETCFLVNTPSVSPIQIHLETLLNSRKKCTTFSSLSYAILTIHFVTVCRPKLSPETWVSVRKIKIFAPPGCRQRWRGAAVVSRFIHVILLTLQILVPVEQKLYRLRKGRYSTTRNETV